jgi:hypothetical protein
VLIGVEDQIAAKRTIRERRYLTNHVSGGSGPRQRQHAEYAGIRDRCRQLGTADIGACTIGCSIPSSSQTGVRTNSTYPSFRCPAVRSNSEFLQPAATSTRLAGAGRSGIHL